MAIHLPSQGRPEREYYLLVSKTFHLFNMGSEILES